MPEKIVREIKRIQELTLPKHHAVLVSDLNPDSLSRLLLKAYERQPKSFRELLEVQGVGAKTVRALAMVADLVWGAPASTRDPAKFSFAHGGKDGYPYPVDRRNYDTSIEVMKKAVEKSRVGDKEKLDALKRLPDFTISKRAAEAVSR
jgi:hypothetical protein